MTTTAKAVHRAYTDGRFGQIHYRRAGAAGARSPLLLLHPAPLSSLMFEGFMPEMGRDRTVIAPDMPGYGLSDAPPTQPSIGDYAAAMLDLVDSLGLGMVDVMGYHTGAMTAVEMARRQRAAVVRRVIMISAPLFTPEELSGLKAQHAPKPVEEHAATLAARWQVFRKETWRMELSDVRAWEIFMDAQRNPEIAPWGYRAAFDYPLTESLAEITLPVLVLNPKDEMAAYTPRVEKQLKNGRIQNLEWSGGFLSAKAFETAAILREFLA